MEEFITWVLGNLDYWVVFVFMIIESSFIPFPSEVIVPPAAWLSLTEDKMNFILVVVIATLGANIGALINYYLAKWLGRPVVYKFANSKLGHLCLLSQEKVENAEEYFRKHGAASTFFGRLVPAVRQLISIPAGLSGMKLGPFLLYTTLGAGAWNLVLALIGYGIYAALPAVRSVEDVVKYATEYSHLIGYCILVIAAMVVAWMVYKQWYKKRK